MLQHVPLATALGVINETLGISGVAPLKRSSG